jgi:hypothetical protein
VSDNTKSSLDSLFKYKVAKEVNELVPSFTIIQEMMGDLSPATKAGRKFLWPVALTLENGVTYGDGTVFTYNGAIAAVYGEAQIDAAPIVVQSRVSLSAANTMLDDESTFITETKLRAGTMKESLMKRLEIESLYGKSAVGIGVIASQSGSGTTRALVLSEATFAAAIWGGMENCLLECRNTSGTIQNSNADIVLVSVDPDTRTLNVSGNATDLDACGAADVMWFKGQYANGFNGIHKQLTNTGSLFNIDAAVYQLWKASSYAVGGALTMAKSLRGLAKAVGKGGLTGSVIQLVSPETYEGLNADLSALRMFDSSYSGEGQSGFEGISYRYQGGKLKVIAHPYCMPGYSYAGPEKGIRKIGRVDVNFGMGGDDYFEKLEGSAGYQLLCQAEWSVFIEKPARWVIYTGITNAA